MDMGAVKSGFARRLGSGPAVVAATADGTFRTTGAWTGLRADFAASLYGVGCGYTATLLIPAPATAAVIGRDTVLVIDGAEYVVIGVRKFAGVAFALDLREGV